MGNIFKMNEEPRLEVLIKGSGDILNLNDVNFIGKSTCLIEYIVNNRKAMGTGFLIELPIPDSNNPMKGLITNYHVLNYKILKKIEISLNFFLEKKTLALNLKQKRFIFSDSFIDITFIELDNKELEELGINCLEIEEEKFLISNGLTDSFIVQNPNGILSFAQGKILKRWGFNLYHSINTIEGSSGSPLVLEKNNKVIGVHKSGMKQSQYNIASNIQVIVKAIRNIYNNRRKITNKLSLIKKARTPLSEEEINELNNHGLIQTNSPYIFQSPSSFLVSSLWFYRTNHAWYWTPKEPKINNNEEYECNWLIIYPGGSLRVIGGFYHGQEPAQRNIDLIHWLESTKLKYLV